MTTADFYEDDEDPKEIHAAFNRAVKGYTQAPQSAQTWTVGTTTSITRTWPDSHTDTS